MDRARRARRAMPASLYSSETAGAPMTQPDRILDYHPAEKSFSLLRLYRSVPLYLRILVALGIGIALGVLLGPNAEPLKWVSQIILRFLGALAPALILVAVIDSILNANIHGRSAGRLIYLLALNTLVAILIGLLVANVIQPGKRGYHAPASQPAESAPKTAELGHQLIENIPKSVLEPL